MHKHEQKRKKGPVGPGEEESDKLESFCCHLYESHNPVTAPVFVPEELPPRYAINFVPALPVSVPAPDSVISPVPVSVPVPVPASAGYSVVSSVNFVLPAPSVPVPVPATTPAFTGYSVIFSVNFVVPAASRSVSSSTASISSLTASTSCIETT